jgi:acetyl esterase/lipase
MSEASYELRKAFKEGDDVRDAGLTTPDDVVRFDDIVYGDNPKWQSLDVYRPKDKEGEKLPVIVSIHGGGWVYGDKERYQYYCMSLAQNGFAVVNYTYRLAPEFKFPAPIEDANLVFSWILDNADKYDMDTENIFAVGDSAGGNILGLYSGVLTNPEYAAKYSFKVPKGLKLKGVALNCGDYAITPDDPENKFAADLMKDYLPNGGTTQEFDMVNVLKHITKDFPPTFFMTCTGDMLIGQALKLQKVLVENEVPNLFRFYGNSEKSLGHVFHCNMKLAEAHKCNKDECEFFRSLMHSGRF